MQLAALPIICTLDIESIQSPQLEHFLKQSIEVEYDDAPNWIWGLFLMQALEKLNRQLVEADVAVEIWMKNMQYWRVGELYTNKFTKIW